MGAFRRASPRSGSRASSADGSSEAPESAEARDAPGARFRPLGSAELLDALGDQLRLHSLFERLDLFANPAVEVGYLVTQPLPGSVGGLGGGLLVGAQLAGEVVEPHGAEDGLAEEALDEREEGVLAD